MSASLFRYPFFCRPTEQVAPDLLGWQLRHAGVCLTITETEAYLGAWDRASHARPGPTERNSSMFGPVDRAYVYRSYGIHLCFNVVAHAPEAGGAVLIRAGRVVEGLALAQSRRGRGKGLADGPGKLAQALALETVYDGCDLAHGPVLLMPPSSEGGRNYLCSPRVGITKDAERPLRFVLEPLA